MTFKKKAKLILCTSIILASLMLCGSVYVYASSKEPQIQSIKSINLLIENCNVIVKNSTNDQFIYDYNQSNYKVTQTINGTNMGIKVEKIGNGKAEALTDMIVIYLPPWAYDDITVDGKKAGVGLPELNANLHLTNNGGAMSTRVPEGFDKTIDFSNSNGSGALVISYNAKDYLLKVASQDSAVSVPPKFPVFTPNSTWQYQNENGTAKINLDLQGCAFAIVVEDE